MHLLIFGWHYVVVSQADRQPLWLLIRPEGCHSGHREPGPDTRTAHTKADRSGVMAGRLGLLHKSPCAPPFGPLLCVLRSVTGSRRLPWRSSFGDDGIAPKATSLIAAICAHYRKSIRLGHWALHPCTTPAAFKIVPDDSVEPLGVLILVQTEYQKAHRDGWAFWYLAGGLGLLAPSTALAASRPALLRYVVPDRSRRS